MLAFLRVSVSSARSFMICVCSSLCEGVGKAATCWLLRSATNKSLPAFCLPHPTFELNTCCPALTACHLLHAGLDNVTVVWARAEEGGRKPELRDVSGRPLLMQVQSGCAPKFMCLPFETDLRAVFQRVVRLDLAYHSGYDLPVCWLVECMLLKANVPELATRNAVTGKK
jgi:hypothetical protein